MVLHCFLPFPAEDPDPIGRALRTAAYPLDSNVPDELLRVLEKLAERRGRAVAEMRPLAAR